MSAIEEPSIRTKKSRQKRKQRPAKANKMSAQGHALGTLEA